jgi:UDP-glucose 4-epimerase
MKVLVTGGAGYVGGVSVDAILAAGHDVVVLDDLTTGHRAIVNDGARLVVGSYANPAVVGPLLETERPDAILHCAARSLVAESIRDPGRYYRDNVAGGVALLEAARAAGIGAIVFSSTAAVYGVPDATPIAEDAPLRPINPYGETKRTLEGALRWYGAAYGLRSVGSATSTWPGDRTDRRGAPPESHLVPNVLIAAEGGPGLTVFGEDYPTPTARRSATTSTSRISPTRTSPRSPWPRATRGRRPRGADRGAAGPPTAIACNLGTSTGFGARGHARGRDGRRPADPAHRGSATNRRSPVLVASNALAGELLGWTPRRSTLEAMIGSAWAWRRAHPDGYGD